MIGSGFGNIFKIPELKKRISIARLYEALRSQFDIG